MSRQLKTEESEKVKVGADVRRAKVKNEIRDQTSKGRRQREARAKTPSGNCEFKNSETFTFLLLTFYF
jgi:hypothetical protein